MTNELDPTLFKSAVTPDWHNRLADCVADVSDMPVVILSDFDNTLCNVYSFDPSTNNHLPKISDEQVAAARDHHMVIATARRATNPAIQAMWRSGLVHKDRPVIAENGGTILFCESDGGVASLDLVEAEEVMLVKKKALAALEEVGPRAWGQELIVKEGRTMMVARLQDGQGNHVPEDQAWLAERLREVVDDGSIRVVDGRSSVTIQSVGIDKARAFRTYLDLYGIQRQEVNVIGMGDGENDHEIFTEADLSIGFSDVVAPFVDVHIPEGAAGTVQVLQTIKEAK